MNKEGVLLLATNKEMKRGSFQISKVKHRLPPGQSYAPEDLEFIMDGADIPTDEFEGWLNIWSIIKSGKDVILVTHPEDTVKFPDYMGGKE